MPIAAAFHPLVALIFFPVVSIIAAPSSVASAEPSASSSPPAYTCEITLPKGRSPSAIRQLPGSTFRCTMFVPPPPAAALRSSTPIVVHVDHWPEPRTDFSAWVIAVFTGVLAFFTVLLWRSTEYLAGEAHQTARKELRAFAVPVNIQFVNIEMGTGEVEITVRNLGRTPAYKIAVRARAEIASSEDHLSPIDDTGPPTGHLAPGTDTMVTYPILPAVPKNGEEFDSATARVYVHGRITYTDTFGKKRWSTFRQAEIADRKLIACNTGNDTDDSEDIGQTKLRWWRSLGGRS